jgi:hypothetical protein
MANTIKLGYSNTSGQTPDTLAGGEVGINTSNRKIWAGNGTGNTLVFNHADYAPATANASETYVNGRGFLTAVSGSSFFASTSHNHNSTYLGISSKAADSGLLDGVDSLKYLKGYGNVSGWQNSNANFSIRSGSPSVGLHMEGASGEFGFQLYSSGSDYGFLDAVWGSWDIRKTENGNFEVDEGSGLKRVWNAGNVSAGTGISISGQTITNTVTQLTDAQVRSKFTGGVGVAVDASGVLSTALSELPDMTATLWPPSDEFIVLDAGIQKRKLATEIFGNHAFGAVDTTVTSTSTTTAASASSVKAAYDRAWMSASTTLSDLGYYGHANANSYSHPLGNGNRHMPGYGSTGQILKNTGPGNASWQAETDTTYPVITSTVGGVLSNTDAVKFASIAASANNYSFPYTITSASTASSLAYRDSSGDLTARLFRSEYDTVATASSIGYINVQYDTASNNYIRPATAASVRTFLDVASGANNYSHPTGAGNKHIPSGGSSGQFLKFDSLGTAVWAADNNTTYTLSSLGFTGATNANYITNNNQLTNGAVYITAAGNTQLTDTQVRNKFTPGVGIAMDSSGVLSTALNELSDHTPSLFPNTDEFIILANGSQKRKLASEIFSSHCFGALNNTVTSTSTTAAASANSVRLAYDRTWSTAPNNAQANVGIQFSGALSGSGMNVNAGYISHYSGTPWNHIPANGGSNQYLAWSSAGTAMWSYLPSAYTLPAASSSIRGGVKTGYTPTATVEYAVQTTASDQMYVVVNNHTTTWNGLENISNLTVLP